MILSLEKPSYIYLIECEDLGLYYIGIRKERDFETDGDYLSSSRLCKALQVEFKDYTWQKHLLEVTSSFDEALEKETYHIKELRRVAPTGLINLAANDVTNFWVFDPTHLPKDLYQRARQAAMRGDEQPLVSDRFLNVCFTKLADGSAHAPMMPQYDMTPHPTKGNWPQDLLDNYNALPPGYYHYYSVVGFRANGQKRFKVLGFVESFKTELECRVTSSRVCKMPFDDYAAYVVARLK
jgi:predicted GIY-YIG superfamily endonuclease